MYSQTELKELVEKALISLEYDTEAEKLISPVKYALSVGGKRLRPVLSLMACNMFSDNITDAVLPAAGLEVFHNFTLVHDDMMDQADVRRNLPTVHKKWDTNQAILSGDVMAFIANECFLRTPASCLHKVFTIYNKTAVEVCIGQQLDMDFEKRDVVSEQDYLRMIELKTAVLFAASLKIGAVIGGADDKDADVLYEFGRNLGLAFQIQDDYLDTYGDIVSFGKKPGGDIVANKKTFLLVKALETASPAQLTRLRELIAMKDPDPAEKISNMMDLYDQLNIKALTEKLESHYMNSALEMLKMVNAGADRKTELEQLVVSMKGRNK